MPTLSKLAEGEVLLSTSRPAGLPLDELPSKPLQGQQSSMPGPQSSDNEAKTPGGAATDLTALVLKSGTLVPAMVKISPIVARSAEANLKLVTTSDASVKESTPKRVTPSNAAAQEGGSMRVAVTVVRSSRDTALGLKVRSFKGSSGVEVRIDRILPGSVFEKTALEEGLTIESINGERYDSFLDCIALLKQAVGEMTLVAVAPTNEAQAPLDSDKENAPPAVEATTKRKSDAAEQNEPVVKKSLPPKSKPDDQHQLKSLDEISADPAAVVIKGATVVTVRSSRGTKIFHDEAKKRVLESLDDATKGGCNEKAAMPIQDFLKIRLGAPRYYERLNLPVSFRARLAGHQYRLMVDDKAISQAIRARMKNEKNYERRKKKAAMASLPASQANVHAPVVHRPESHGSDEENGYESGDTLPLAAPKPAFQANASVILTRPYAEDTMPPSMLLPALFHLAKQESDAPLVVAAKKALAGRQKKQLKGVGASTSMQASRLQEEMQSKLDQMAVVLKTETIALDRSMG